MTALIEKNGYVNGLRHGLFPHYYQSGNVMSIGQWLNGQKNGEQIGYYDNGNIKYRVQYLNGVEHGESIMAYSDGTICYHRVYVNGICLYNYNDLSQAEKEQLSNEYGIIWFSDIDNIK